MRIHKILIEDGELELLPRFLDAERANHYYRRLAGELQWRDEWIKMGARSIKVPRQVAWYGDPDACYRYSGVEHTPLPWTAVLAELRTDVQATCGQAFNSVLANFYRDDRDSMDWHADREPELGRNPYTASLSLGAERLFKLRHNASGRLVDLPLPDGSLLLMHGALQHHWRHCLPKARHPSAPRINLTFRLIQPR
jgi:alkylated DNA repair dioxygenase AlkB